jgi:hypothetical protein
MLLLLLQVLTSKDKYVLGWRMEGILVEAGCGREVR